MKTLNRSYSVENVDAESDNIFVNLNLTDINEKYKIHLQNKIIYKAYAFEAKFVF